MSRVGCFVFAYYAAVAVATSISELVLLRQHESTRFLVDPLRLWQKATPQLVLLNTMRRELLLRHDELCRGISCRKSQQCDELILNNASRHKLLTSSFFAEEKHVGTRPTILYARYIEDCNRKQDVESCSDDQTDAIGNKMVYYWMSRAAAKVGKTNFILLKESYTCTDNIMNWLPMVWQPPSRIHFYPGNYTLSASHLCRGAKSPKTDKNLHLMPDLYRPVVAEIRAELRSALKAWERVKRSHHHEAVRNDYLPPLDDIAIHFRCGDAFSDPMYGVLPFAAIASLVPIDKPKISLGIITQPFEAECPYLDYLNMSSYNKHFPYRANNNGTTRPTPMKSSLHGIRAGCACECLSLVLDLIDTLKMLRPHVAITVHSMEPIISSWWRLVHAPIATICQTSTFCFWPTIAATRGFFLPTLMVNQLPGLSIIRDPPYVSLRRLLMEGGGACGTPHSIDTIRENIFKHLIPRDLTPSINATNITVELS